eukprot:CAMPEP_0117435496 /NCGR_PEP_ID=MMETSP0759-20121206/513_1 /TAXON_ID=63605 /ORGANISM="Percolomonas cosmopolitus, Strain WS" /LENGTH=344 /DNA_ID=CAMNT_0005227049 /DNA_START=160 /DNA_END=1194 /DNA_ORIENTATION=+
MSKQAVRDFSSNLKPAQQQLFKRAAFNPTRLTQSAPSSPSFSQQLMKYQSRSQQTLMNLPRPRTQNEQYMWIAGGIVALGLAYWILNQTLNTGIETGEGISPAVRQYLRGTYAYLTSGVAITAASAVAFWRNGTVLRLMAEHPMGWMIGSSLLCIGALIGCRMVDPRNVALKHAMFVAFTVLEGATLSVFGLMGRAVLQKAGLYTMGIFLAMSLIALNAKNERFLYMGGALYSVLMVVVMASFASMGLAFFGRMPRAVAAMDAFVLWGGLALFTAFLLYHTQVIVNHGKQYAALEGPGKIVSAVGGPRSGPVPDYINEALHLYMDIVNIFIRLAIIFSGNQRRK